MNPKPLWISLFFLLLLTGCGSKSYYTLGDTSDIEATHTYTQSIAVQKVDIPKYLKDNNLVRQVTPYQIIRIKDSNWLTPMQRRLTNVLINYLQKSLNNPNVYLYPWEKNKDTRKKVSLTIKRFIAYNHEVILEANYKIYDFNTKKYITKLFSSKVKTAEHTDAIMKSMEEAYFQLIEEIKSELLKKT